MYFYCKTHLIQSYNFICMYKELHNFIIQIKYINKTLTNIHINIFFWCILMLFFKIFLVICNTFCITNNVRVKYVHHNYFKFSI